MTRLLLAFVALAFASSAHAGKLYRVDLRITEEGKPPDSPLLIVENGKQGSIEVAGPDGKGRRYEIRVDASEDAKGKTTGTVDVRAVNVTKRGDKELGRDVVAIAQTGVPFDWKPKKKPKGLEIQVVLYLQPM
ncbi:MAG TPA: hypothetical protein VFL14_11505 [Xanthomonadales bacterium]|nr:hypothetical protein [Xanthomonadales bacterium]